MPIVPTAFSRRLPVLLLAVSACLLGLWTSLVPLVGLDGSRLPGDLVDGRFPGYVLEHGWLWLTGRAASFWSAPFYYPMPGVIALSDNMVGALPLYGLLRLFSPTPEQAMVGLAVACFLLNFGLAVAFFRSCGAGLGPAAVAAYPVAFGLFVASQAGRIHCLQLYPVLLGLWALARFLREPTTGRALFLSGATTLLALSSFYYCVFFLLLAGVAGLSSMGLGLTRPRAVVTALRPNAGAYLFFAGCLLFAATDYWPYFRESLETGSWNADQALTLAPSLPGLFTPPHGSLLWNWLEGVTLAGAEDHLFPGLLPLAGLGFGVWLFARRRRTAAGMAGVLMLSALVVGVAFLDVWGAHSLVRRLPGVASLRVTTRVAAVIVPCCGLGLALLLESLVRRLPARVGPAVLVAALALAAADQYVRPEAYPSHAWRPARERVEALARRVPVSARVFYVQPDAPVGDPRYWAVHLDAMLAAQRLGKATYNGYSSWLPPVLGLFYDQGGCAALDAWRNVAASLYHPDQPPVALYAQSAFLGGPYCPPDPVLLSRPQGRHLASLPAADRRAEIRTNARFARSSHVLKVDAVIRNLGGRPLHGLGDFSHQGAVFLVARVTDAAEATTFVPLSRLDRSIAPGETVAQHGEARLAPGPEPRRVEAVLVQAPNGKFTVTPDTSVPVRLDP